MPVYLTSMAADSTLLCIHRDPAQLSLLREHGYKLVTATNGSEGLRLFTSRSVDAIVLGYHLGLLDGGVVAGVIKKLKPKLPIVMLAEDAELSDEALKSIDALVARSDDPHFLLATVRSVLGAKQAPGHDGELRVQTPVHLRRPGRSRERVGSQEADTTQLAADDRNAPFSPGVWRSIWDGTVQF